MDMKIMQNFLHMIHTTEANRNDCLSLPKVNDDTQSVFLL